MQKTENYYQTPSTIQKGVGKTAKIGCLLFIVFIVIAVVIFLIVAFFNSLFDRNRMVGTYYTMSSGVTGNAKAIEFPFAVRGGKIKALGISPEADTDFYVRTKSGDTVLTYKNKTIEYYIDKNEAEERYSLGLSIVDSEGRGSSRFNLGKKIDNPKRIGLYILDYGGVSNEDYKKMRENPIEISVDGKTWYDFPVSLKNAQKMFGEIVEAEDYTGKGI